jgi:hypothetical protein
MLNRTGNLAGFAPGAFLEIDKDLFHASFTSIFRFAGREPDRKQVLMVKRIRGSGQDSRKI